MDSPHQLNVGATFYPGGVDDFYMPEVISPAPQRSMPEVPGQIQSNLAQFELEGSPPSRLSGLQSPETMPTSSFGQEQLPYLPSTSIQLQHNESRGHQSSRSEYPSFSPFPQIPNRPPNVPPSDDEKETILEDARETVLNSNDAEIQLTWAQDASAYVDVAMANEVRMSAVQPPRPGTPRVEHLLRQDSISVVQFLADQHHPKAEFMRGMWLEFGKFGFRMDKKEAYRCYSRAAQNGYARAEYRMGMQFEMSNDIGKAVKHYSLGVEAGDSASCYRLGMMTLLGQQGHRQDYGRGVELIKFSADSADEFAPQGAYVYGMLQAGQIPQVSVPEFYLPLDNDSAFFNIEKAAYLGFAKAQTKMGAAYELCQLGCDFNPALSLHYNNLAARQGEAEAEMAISKWFLSGQEGIFKKSDEIAFTYALRATKTGLPTAEFAVGYFYEVGIHVAANIEEAKSWYSKAAEHGNKDALARIEGIDRLNTLSRKDHERIAVAKITTGRTLHYKNRPKRFSTPGMPGVSGVPPTTAISSGILSMPEPVIPTSSYAGHNPYTPPAPSASYPGFPYVSPVIAESSSFLHQAAIRSHSIMPSEPPRNQGSYGSMALSPTAGLPLRPHSTANTGNGYGRGPPLQQADLSRQPRPGYQPLQTNTMSPAPVNPPDSRRHSNSMPLRPVSGQGSLPSLGPQSIAMNEQEFLRPPGVGGRSSSTPFKPGHDARRTPLPTVNIGFIAPPDLSGADRKQRPQRIENPNTSYPSNGTGYNIRPERKSSRLPITIQEQPSVNTDRVSSSASSSATSASQGYNLTASGQPPNSYPVPGPTAPQGYTLTDHGRTSNSHQAHGNPISSTRPPRNESLPMRPAGMPNSVPSPTPPPSISAPSMASSSASQPPGGRRPGKGPATFEEMGVPATKHEQDCILM